MFFVKFYWWWGPIHFALTLWQIGPYHLALHVTAHRMAWKNTILDKWLPVVLGPFFGQTWYTYYFHHIKVSIFQYFMNGYSLDGGGASES
jgi:hypothetical protein